MPIKSGWTKESALVELRHLADETRELASGTRFSEAHSRWWARTLAVLEEVFGGRSRYFSAIAGLKFYETRDFVVFGIYDMDKQADSRHQKAFERDLETCRGLLGAAADHLERSDLSAVFEGKDTPPESSNIVRVINLAERNLRKIIRDVPTKEKQVQDAFENLLVGAELSYFARNRKY